MGAGKSLRPIQLEPASGMAEAVGAAVAGSVAEADVHSTGPGGDPGGGGGVGRSGRRLCVALDTLQRFSVADTQQLDVVAKAKRIKIASGL